MFFFFFFKVWKEVILTTNILSKPLIFLLLVIKRKTNLITKSYVKDFVFLIYEKIVLFIQFQIMKDF